MNQLDTMRRRRETINLVRISNRSLNTFRWSETETEAHIMKKFELCRMLKRQGKDFMTEAIFNTGDRADVLCLDDGIAYEVVDSESKESIEKKKIKYPVQLVMVKV